MERALVFIVYFLFFILGCSTDSRDNKLLGDMNKVEFKLIDIVFDHIVKKRDGCKVSRVYVYITIVNNSDSVLIFTPSVNSSHCNFLDSSKLNLFLDFKGYRQSDLFKLRKSNAVPLSLRPNSNEINEVVSYTEKTIKFEMEIDLVLNRSLAKQQKQMDNLIGRNAVIYSDGFIKGTESRYYLLDCSELSFSYKLDGKLVSPEDSLSMNAELPVLSIGDLIEKHNE